MKKLLIAAIAANPIVVFANADDAAATLDPVLVTATRAPQAQSDIAVSTTVISREEIERAQAADLAELLRRTAGLDVGRNGGPGQTSSVFLRGASSSQTLVLLDGVRLNPGSIGGGKFEDINPETIERIEIVKGPRSSLYGSDAIGGVIQIFTRKSTQQGLTADVALSGGSFSTREGSALVGWRGERGGVSANLADLDTDGFPARKDFNQDAAHHNTSGSLNGDLQLGRATLTLGVTRNQGRTEYVTDDFNTFPSTPVPVSYDFSQDTVQTGVKADVLKNWQSELSLQQQRDQRSENDANLSTGDFDFTKTRRQTADWRNTVTLPQGTAVIGLTGYKESISSLSFGTKIAESVHSRAAYGQWTMPFSAASLLLAGRYTAQDGFDGVFTGNVEFLAPVWTGGKLSVAAGTGYRAPNAVDRFGFGGNPDLKPERSSSVEFGLNQALGAHRFRIAAFSTQIHDLIQFVDPDGFFGPQPGANTNIERAEIKGVELSWAWSDTHWSAHLNTTLQDPKLTKGVAGSSIQGEKLARRSGSSISGEIIRKFGPHELSLSAVAQDRREDGNFDNFGGANATLAGYGLLNASARFALLKGLSLTLAGQNLLDHSYELAKGFRTPGASGTATLRYRW